MPSGEYHQLQLLRSRLRGAEGSLVTDFAVVTFYVTTWTWVVMPRYPENDQPPIVGDAHVLQSKQTSFQAEARSWLNILAASAFAP